MVLKRSKVTSKIPGSVTGSSWQILITVLIIVAPPEVLSKEALPRKFSKIQTTPHMFFFRF